MMAAELALQHAYDLYAQRLQSPEGKRARDYLRSMRGLTAETLQRFGLGYAPKKSQDTLALGALDDLVDAGLVGLGQDTGKPYALLRDRVTFPIRAPHGRVIAFGGRRLDDTLLDTPKYLNSPETAFFQKRDTVYGLWESLSAHGTDNLPRLVVVEGYLDVASLHQHGMTNAVAPLGTALTAQQVARMARHTQHITFCFDGDAAGTRAARHAFEQVLPLLGPQLHADFAFIPSGHDPDSLVREFGKEAFLDVLWHAQDVREFACDALTPKCRDISLEHNALALEQAQGWINTTLDPEIQTAIADGFYASGL